jgi:hypothetical protein
MFTRFFTWPVRHYAYAIGEVVSVGVFGYTFSTFFIVEPSSIHPMSMPSAACFMALSFGTFVLSTCLKRIDEQR